MAALTNYTENQIINHIFRTTAFTRPTTLYIGLIISGTDFEAGTVVEVNGSGYARVARNPSDANWTGPVTSGTTTNTDTIQFPAATANNWGVASYLGIWDQITGGNLLIYAPLTASVNVATGVNASFAANTLVFQIDN